MKTSYHSRHHIVIFENYIPVQVIFKHSHTVIHTGPKLTAREDRESRNMMNLGEQSVYTRTQLTEGSSNGCLHFDPVFLLLHQHPSAVLLALEQLKFKNHFVCSCLSTILTDRSNMGYSYGCYIWTQPISYIPHHHLRESSIERESHTIALI